MEKVLFFDIPKLKPNYFLIVIGICLLLIIIYSLTKVYLPDLMLEFTIMACLSDFIGFCLIYFIIEILRYSKNVKNKLSCILSDAERLLSHAKVGEDVLKCFLGGDALFARDFCKVVDDDAEIFGKEVAT